MSAKWEFIDHPADIQLHAWGTDMGLVLEQLAKAFYEVMFESDKFEEKIERNISVTGSDKLQLVYNFLDEWLFAFDTEEFVAKRVKVTKCDFENLVIEATGYGDTFEIEKHNDLRRTEVKAITYASMKVENEPGKAEIYVIIDL